MNIATKKHRGPQVLAALVALLLAVGPLGLLQVVAWTGMAINYGTRYGVAEGLERTFDGQHPCFLCKEITKTRADKKDTQTAVTVTPVKLVCVIATVVQSPSAGSSGEKFTYFPSADFHPIRTDRPASPPPRTLAA